MNARQQAEARLQETGPFIITKKASDGRPIFKNKSGGWVTNRDKAWRFDTEKQARFILRGGDGEVVPMGSDNSEQTEADGDQVVCKRCGHAWLEPKWKAGYLKAICPKCRYSFNNPGASGGKVHDLVPVPADGLQKLTKEEREEFSQCESAIEMGVTIAGLALSRIRQLRLYREQFKSWDDYIEARWGFSPRHAHRLCEQAEVHRNLLTNGAAGNLSKAGAGELTKLVSLPQAVNLPKESQTRHLARLKPEEQPAAWQEAQESANGGRVTARHVEAAVAKRLPAPKPSEIKWPQSDESGYYPGEMTEAQCFSQKNVWVQIGGLQVGEYQWAPGFRLIAKPGSPIGEMSACRTPSKEWICATPTSALHDAASMLRDEISPLQRTVVTRDAKTLLQDIIDWSHGPRSQDEEAPSAQNGSAPAPVQVRAHERKAGSSVLQRLAPINAKAGYALTLVSELVAMLDKSQDVSTSALEHGKKAKANLLGLEKDLDWLVKCEQREAAIHKHNVRTRLKSLARARWANAVRKGTGR